jgi:hypothetical protein
MDVIAVDFLFGPGLFSWFIGWFGLGAHGYSHAASVLRDGRYLDARSDRLAGVEPGVHIRYPETERWVRKRRASLVVTEEEYATWEANLRAKITDGYGVIDIFDFLDGDERHAPGRWICSALAINAIQHVSRVHWKPGHLGFIPYPLAVPAHQITPNSCLLLLQTAGFTLGEEEISR